MFGRRLRDWLLNSLSHVYSARSLILLKFAGIKVSVLNGNKNTKLYQKKPT